MTQHILLVEDNPTNQLVIRRMLEKMDFMVTVAGNGQEGVDYWREDSFDAIVMDIQMPVMDGIEASRVIRNQDTRYYTPIIALTANAQQSIEDECYAVGMDAFLTKPVDRELLQKTIITLIDEHKLSSSA